MAIEEDVHLSCKLLIPANFKYFFYIIIPIQLKYEDFLNYIHMLSLIRNDCSISQLIGMSMMIQLYCQVTKSFCFHQKVKVNVQYSEKDRFLILDQTWTWTANSLHLSTRRRGQCYSRDPQLIWLISTKKLPKSDHFPKGHLSSFSKSVTINDINLTI